MPSLIDYHFLLNMVIYRFCRLFCHSSFLVSLSFIYTWKYLYNYIIIDFICVVKYRDSKDRKKLPNDLFHESLSKRFVFYYFLLMID